MNMNSRPSCHSATRRLRRVRRSAAVTLELILTLPIIGLLLVGIVELGLLLGNLQYVEFASRTGALVAMRLSPATLNSGTLPASILSAVNQELNQMTPGAVARQVYLEHNVSAGGGVGPMVMRCGGLTTVPCPYRTVKAPSAPGGATYVRVTVFVDFSEVAPNALASVGLDYSTTVVQQTTTYMWLGP